MKARFGSGAGNKRARSWFARFWDYYVSRNWHPSECHLSGNGTDLKENDKLRFHLPGSDHINVKEAKAYCADVRRVAADPSQHGTRRMTGLDSRVATGANAKGRSSSARLNAPLRRVVPDQLLGGLYYGSNFVRTHVNPADDPTRGRRPRGIEGTPCPAWLEPLLRGDPAEFDRALPAARRQQLRKVGLFPSADLE